MCAESKVFDVLLKAEASDARCCLNIAMKASALSFSSSLDILSADFESSIGSGSASSSGSGSGSDSFSIAASFTASETVELIGVLFRVCGGEFEFGRVEVKRIANSKRLRARKTRTRHCSTKDTTTARSRHAINAAVPAANQTAWT
nr:hypothetical protein TorRG33x02_347410 [Ipomoea batatas]